MTMSANGTLHLLNHVELLHQPGERDLAVTFFETLGCTVVDITKEFGASSTYLCVYPGPSQLDPLNNVLYVSEIRGAQPLDAVLERRRHDDAELRAAIEDEHLRQTRPGGVMHFGLRYPDFDAIEAVVDRLQHRLPAELVGRVTVHEPFPVALPALGSEVLQGFVHTDVVGGGLFPFGQLIELQAQRALQNEPSPA